MNTIKRDTNVLLNKEIKAGKTDNWTYNIPCHTFNSQHLLLKIFINIITSKLLQQIWLPTLNNLNERQNDN